MQAAHTPAVCHTPEILLDEPKPCIGCMDIRCPRMLPRVWLFPSYRSVPNEILCSIMLSQVELKPDRRRLVVYHVLFHFICNSYTILSVIDLVQNVLINTILQTAVRC